MCRNYILIGTANLVAAPSPYEGNEYLLYKEKHSPYKGRVLLAYPLFAAYHTAEKAVDKDKPYVFG